MSGSAPTVPLPYSHTRNDCQVCRERDADLQVQLAETGQHGPAQLCAGCAGQQLALRVLDRAGPAGDQLVTVAVALVNGRAGDVLASGAGPAPRRRVLDRAGRAYPHLVDDCVRCHQHDADVVLVDQAGRPALCDRCAAWSIAVHLAGETAGEATGATRPVRMALAAPAGGGR